MRGDCMLPLLEPGDEVWVRPGPLGDARGRLVAYARFDGAVPEIAVHRMLDDGSTRADARTERDPPDEAAAFVGRVAAVSRAGRVAAFDGPRGRLLDRAGRLYARAFIAPWRERVLIPLEGSWGDMPRRALRWAALFPSRLAFLLLSRRPS